MKNVAHFFYFIMVIIAIWILSQWKLKHNFDTKVYQNVESTITSNKPTTNITIIPDIPAQQTEEKLSMTMNKPKEEFRLGKIENRNFSRKSKPMNKVLETVVGDKNGVTEERNMDGTKNKTEKSDFTILTKSEVSGLENSSTNRILHKDTTGGDNTNDQQIVRHRNATDSVPLGDKQKENKTLAVLFSTWGSSQEKETVHLNILRTWRLWKPHILPALFIDDPNERKKALDHGWDVHPEPRKVCSGVPGLREMFRHAMRTYDSVLYGYSNGDILFGNGILPSLQAVANLSYIHTKPVMVVFRRINVDFVNRPPLENVDNLTEIAKTGKIMSDGSSDGIFTNRHFPWDHVPDVSPGRAGYAMWMVAFARRMGVTIVDISSTTQAVHQTTQSGNFETWKHEDARCNHHLYKKLGIAPNRWWCGNIFCADHRTVKSPVNASTEYAVQDKRKTNPPNCGNCTMRLDGLKNTRFKRR